MSDSSQRRGTYGSQRGIGADGRSRDQEDPLAELARLVSQSDPARTHATSGEPRASYAPPPAAPPRAPYTPPAVDRVQDRLDPLGYRAEPRVPAYGSAQPAYSTQNTDDDFFADEPLRGAQNGSYKTYHDDFDAGYDDNYQARTYNDDYDDRDTAVYPAAEDASEDEMPVRRRGSVKVLVSALSLALIGGLGAWGYSSLGGEETSNGAPPVIKAKIDTPVKVVAQAKPVEKTKESYDRIPVNSDAKVGPAPEEPGEKPSPRVVLPGAPEQLPVENRVAEAPSSPPPQMPAAPSIPERDSTGTVERPQNTGPRVVQTLTIRPDGTPMPSAQAEPPAAPQPIEGSGAAAGMSLQPGPEFGIMQSGAPRTQEPPSQQTAYAPVDVPMPLPRPPEVRDAPPPPASPTPQARAATLAPAPAISGPPSSPQPQVTVTNKRALHPQGPIPAPRNTSSQRTEPQRPAARQVAMVGSAAPIVASSAPAPAVAQVATVASSSGGSFGVQLTAQRSEEEAIAAFNTLKQRHPQILGPYTATVARADLGPDRGVFYRAMVPAQSQQDAANLCIQFKSQGVDCIVQRR